MNQKGCQWQVKSENVSTVLPRLRQLQAHFNWNDSGLADALNVHRSYVSRLFSGLRKHIPAESLAHIEKEHGINSAWLATGAGEMLLPRQQETESNQPSVVREGSQTWMIPGDPQAVFDLMTEEELDRLMDRSVEAKNLLAIGALTHEMRRRQGQKKPYTYPK